MMPTEINNEVFLSTAETCQLLGISRETLNRYVIRGIVKRYKQGLRRNALYKEAEIQALARKQAEVRED